MPAAARGQDTRHESQSTLGKRLSWVELQAPHLFSAGTWTLLWARIREYSFCYLQTGKHWLRIQRAKKEMLGERPAGREACSGCAMGEIVSLHLV